VLVYPGNEELAYLSPKGVPLKRIDNGGSEGFYETHLFDTMRPMKIERTKSPGEGPQEEGEPPTKGEEGSPWLREGGTSLKRKPERIP